MQIENDYDKEVYNGDIGYIDDVDPDDGELTASFNGRTVTYGFGELDGTVNLPNGGRATKGRLPCRFAATPSSAISRHATIA
jgi:hypothetical protein